MTERSVRSGIKNSHSGCLPGPALRQGEQILSSATRAVSSSPAGGFPVRNILAIAGVVTAIAMVFIYQWGASSTDDELSPEIQAQIDAARATENA